MTDEDCIHRLIRAIFRTENIEKLLIGAFSLLPDRERRVLKLRFGFEDGRPRTLEEVGREFNVSRERIRQIEAKALLMLRRGIGII